MHISGEKKTLSCSVLLLALVLVQILCELMDVYIITSD